MAYDILVYLIVKCSKRHLLKESHYIRLFADQLIRIVGHSLFKQMLQTLLDRACHTDILAFIISIIQQFYKICLFIFTAYDLSVRFICITDDTVAHIGKLFLKCHFALFLFFVIDIGPMCTFIRIIHILYI